MKVMLHTVVKLVGTVLCAFLALRALYAAYSYEGSLSGVYVGFAFILCYVAYWLWKGPKISNEGGIHFSLELRPAARLIAAIWFGLAGLLAFCFLFSAVSGGGGGMLIFGQLFRGDASPESLHSIVAVGGVSAFWGAVMGHATIPSSRFKPSRLGRWWVIGTVLPILAVYSLGMVMVVFDAISTAPGILEIVAMIGRGLVGSTMLAITFTPLVVPFGIFGAATLWLVGMLVARIAQRVMGGCTRGKP